MEKGGKMRGGGIVPHSSKNDDKKSHHPHMYSNWSN